jgi:hypothetical protein
MSGRIILTLSAILLFIAGLATLFAPKELARELDPGASPSLALFVQLLGSGALGFALMNWMSRRNRIGGIYGRPLAMGNLLLFGTSALSVGKAVAAKGLPEAGSAFCIVLGLLAVSFAWLIFVHDPVSDTATKSAA